MAVLWRLCLHSTRGVRDVCQAFHWRGKSWIVIHRNDWMDGLSANILCFRNYIRDRIISESNFRLLMAKSTLCWSRTNAAKICFSHIWPQISLKLLFNVCGRNRWPLFHVWQTSVRPLIAFAQHWLSLPLCHSPKHSRSHSAQTEEGRTHKHTYMGFEAFYHYFL